MTLYFAYEEPSAGTIGWFGTKAEAVKAAREYLNRDFEDDGAWERPTGASIAKCHVEVTRENVLNMVNGRAFVSSETVVATLNMK